MTARPTPLLSQQLVPVLSNSARATSTGFLPGPGVDGRGWDYAVVFVDLTAGQLTGSDTINVRLQDSPDIGGTFSPTDYVFELDSSAPAELLTFVMPLNEAAEAIRFRVQVTAATATPAFSLYAILWNHRDPAQVTTMTDSFPTYAT